MELSVHIVSCGRLALLKACCESVALALPRDAEVIVILNGDCPGAVDFFLALNHPQFRWVQVPRESLSRSRNRAYDICVGEVIYYLDDDVLVPEHLFESALGHFKRDPEVAVLGGANLTPPDSPWLENLFGAMMTSAIAAPMVRRRYELPRQKTQIASQHNLIFCNLACRRRLIPADLRFREDFVSNQENLFIYSIREMGIKAVLCSDLFVYHRRRQNLKSFIHQLASYGCGRFQQTWASWKSCHPLYLVPPFVLLVTLGLIFAQNFKVLFFCIGIYSILAQVGGLTSKTLRQAGFAAWVLIIPLTAVVHLAYGVGWWRGLFAQLNVFRGVREGLLFGHWQNGLRRSEG